MPKPHPACLQAALDYLGRGWSPIPLCPPDHKAVSGIHETQCKSPGKVPLWPWGKYQVTPATAKELELLWGRNPHCNVGLALGPVSGLIGVENVDGPAGLALLQHILGTIPKTLAFRTPGGTSRGRLLFQCPSTEPGNRSIKADGHEALRILSKGSQTVMPPSVHSAGGQYAWTVQSDPLPFPALLAEYLAAPQAPVGDNHVGVHLSPGQATAFTRAKAYIAACDPAVAGEGGHNQTFKVACKIIKGFGLDPETALELLLTDYNPRCQPPWTEKELEHKVADAVKAPGATGTMLNNNGHLNGKTVPPPPIPQLPVTAPKEKLKSVAHARHYGQIEKKSVEWLVPDWLPLGKLSVLDGDPGLGKSTLLIDIAARVTTHGVHFNGKQGPTGNVILLSAEDGPEDTIKPRLEAAGANPQMIHELTHISIGTHERPVEIPLDLDHLEALIAEHKAKLVIIEPLAAFLCGPDANKDQEIRRVLYKLSKLAEKYNCAIIVMRHLNKSGGGKALYRGNMSIGVIGHARIGLLIAEDPDNDAFRILSMTKINCGPKQKSMRFALEPVGEVCRIQWAGQSNYSADDLMQQPTSQEKSKKEDANTKIAQAKAIFTMLLEAKGGVIPIKETKDELHKADISKHSIENAIKELGLTVQYDTMPDDTRVYFWVSPTVPKPPGE